MRADYPTPETRVHLAEIDRLTAGINDSEDRDDIEQDYVDGLAAEEQTLNLELTLLHRQAVALVEASGINERRAERRRSKLHVVDLTPRFF